METSKTTPQFASHADEYQYLVDEGAATAGDSYLAWVQRNIRESQALTYAKSKLLELAARPDFCPTTTLKHLLWQVENVLRYGSPLQFDGICIICGKESRLDTSCWGDGEPAPAEGGAMHVQSALREKAS